MATIQTQFFNASDLMSLYNGFFAQLAKDLEFAREVLINSASIEDVVNSTSPNSQLRKDYNDYMNSLGSWYDSMSRGSSFDNASKSINIYRNYGRLKGKVDRIKTEIDEGYKARDSISSANPSAIFLQTNLSTNIDDYANGKKASNSFVLGDKIMENTAKDSAALGAALFSDIKYKQLLQETRGYLVEAGQYGGFDPELVDLIVREVMQYGESKGCTSRTAEMIKTVINVNRNSARYKDGDFTARNTMDGYILSGVYMGLQNYKAQFITSGKAEDLEYDLRSKQVAISEGSLGLRKQQYVDKKANKSKRGKKEGTNTANIDYNKPTNPGNPEGKTRKNEPEPKPSEPKAKRRQSEAERVLNSSK